jgi:hypothetical protein
MMQTQKLIVRQLDRNVSKTIEQTNRLVEHLAVRGFHPIVAYMKIDSWDAFTVIVTVPDKEWCDPQFLEVFDYVIETEKHTSNEFYNLEIQLFGIPDIDSLNEQSIFADGFILKLNIQ